MPGAAGNVALAGTTLAYSLTTGGIDFFDTSVIERDLISGRVLFSRAASSSTGEVESLYFVQKLVLGARGSVAWVSSKFSLFSHAQTIYEVHMASHTGATSLLDQGTQVVPASLRLTGNLVTWLNGATHRSAPLA